MPKRIQRKRTKGWRMPPNTIYVGRPTAFGNPFQVGKPLDDDLAPWVYEAADRNGIPRNAPLSGEQVLTLYKEHAKLNADLPLHKMLMRQLRGKDLACWCKEYDQNGTRVPCHADILLSIANDIPMEEICAPLIIQSSKAAAVQSANEGSK